MFSIGDLTDKLIIENMKIFALRDKLQTNLSAQEYTETYNKMMLLIENRSIVCNSLDEKILNVKSGKEKNKFLKKVRTYNED